MKIPGYISVGALCLLFLGAIADTMAFNASALAPDVDKALNLQPDPENGRQIYMQCAGCHQPEGWGSEDGVYPQIAGQLPNVTIKQMADIRLRNRDTPIMLPFTMPENVSAQDIVDVAGYIAELPMNPSGLKGPGTDLERGGRLYRQACADCHGADGQGNVEKLVPVIQAQNYPYLMRQFEWFRSGKRRNGDEKMLQQARVLTSAEISAVLDYVSRMRPMGERFAKPGWRNGDFPLFVRNDPLPSPSVCRTND